MAELLYLESSAVVKLVTPEPESRDVEQLVARWPSRVSSILTQVEVARAALRAPAPPGWEARMKLVFSGMTFTGLSGAVVLQAGRLEPAALRSLDAIHLASALSLGSDLAGIVTYDRRLAEAASRMGIPVFP
ncbi:MAG TPA: type II toxin-antitoxin system VapC family toxin [Chloroflexota bacterium]